MPYSYWFAGSILMQRSSFVLGLWNVFVATTSHTLSVFAIEDDDCVNLLTEDGKNCQDFQMKVPMGVWWLLWLATVFSSEEIFMRQVWPICTACAKP